ncbi:MAG: hypothetical protein PHP23_14660 [Desulfobacterales bacterium]|nr:hypothetical protein [Desulfobacterales bacterium]MDD4073509.1 hypothetical protein [Desulfobacterales bacterium]MDD4394159.1 hypothetical protein [Desulfobacterales bacterium]
MWFETLTGFAEQSPEQVRANITVDGFELTSQVNGRRMICGDLETPSLAELRGRVRSETYSAGNTTIREVVANVQHLHSDKENSGSLFQVASQFNLLEMVSPDVTPERGVGIYEQDRTQGPACAIAAGAGTIYRNYFATVNGQTGQSVNNQIDCLADIGTAMGNSDSHLWEMRNGYALATESGLVEISHRLRASSDSERDELRKLLRIGIQWDTQVTLNDSLHKVSQAYCSTLPVAYSAHSSPLWADFAKLVLEAAYEATLCAAILNSRRTGNNTVFLTLLGGGAFGNDTDWIIHAIKRAVELYNDKALDVAIVSYGSSKPSVQKLIHELENTKCAITRG